MSDESDPRGSVALAAGQIVAALVEQGRVHAASGKSGHVEEIAFRVARALRSGVSDACTYAQYRELFKDDFEGR